MCIGSSPAVAEMKILKFKVKPQRVITVFSQANLSPKFLTYQPKEKKRERERERERKRERDREKN